MYSEENRVFKYAIAASIVLHGMLLFGVSLRDRARPGESQMPSILARLVELPAPVPAAEPPQSTPAKARPRVRPEAPKRLVQPAPAPTPTPPAALAPALGKAPLAQNPAGSKTAHGSSP